MVKSKKMSKTSIAVIVLAILLVLSMVMGITGAWFSSIQQTSTVPTQPMKFGNVTLAEFANYTTVNNKVLVADENEVAPGETGYVETWGYPADLKAGSNAEVYQFENVDYYMVAPGTKIATGLTFQNQSTVDTYYLIQQGTGADLKNYVIVDNALVEVAKVAGEGKVAYTDAIGKLAEKEDKSVELIFTLKDTVVKDAFGISTIWDIRNAANEAVEITDGISSVAAYDANVNLGAYMFNGAFTIKAIQASNVGGAAAAFDLLVALA